MGREIQKETIAHYIDAQNKEKDDDDAENGNDDEKKELEKEKCVNAVDGLVNNEKKEKNESEIANEISEEFVLGAIRPIHIREALRKLQHDKASFFCSNSKLFGSE